MVEGLAAVFSGENLGGSHGLDERRIDVGGEDRSGFAPGSGRPRDADLACDTIAVDTELGERKGELGRAGGLRDGAECMDHVIAGELVGAVDNHLRGVFAAEPEAVDIGGLARAELLRGEAVAPAERVPVIDVLFEGEDVGIGDGLGPLQAGQQGVGGWTTGAALGGKQLYQDRGGAGGRGLPAPPRSW